jgi:hypothetical protein
MSHLKEQEARLHRIIYVEYVNKARKKGLTFNLSLLIFSNLLTKDCYYCGQAPLNKREVIKDYSIYYQGIDRINSEEGYIRDNVVPCCKICNYMKSKSSKKEFLLRIDRIYRKHEEQILALKYT